MHPWALLYQGNWQEADKILTKDTEKAMKLMTSCVVEACVSKENHYWGVKKRESQESGRQSYSGSQLVSSNFLGVAFQISRISYIEIMIHNGRKIAFLK